MSQISIPKLEIGDKEFSSRLFIGTGKFSSPELMKESIIASGSQLATVALKRIEQTNQKYSLLEALEIPELCVMPNTSGAKNAKEAILAAELAQEITGSKWLKLEIHPDPRYLMPDPVETLEAAQVLVKKGFIVLPYIHADPVLAKRLEEVGTAAVMPLGSPIGSNKGLASKEFLKIIIEQANVPVVVDAGLGAPSHAGEAIELGADAVLVNTAIAASPNPVEMAKAFKQAVEASLLAKEAGLAGQSRHAEASSPLTSFLAS